MDYVVITAGYDDHLARNLDHSSPHDGPRQETENFKIFHTESFILLLLIYEIVPEHSFK